MTFRLFVSVCALLCALPQIAAAQGDAAPNPVVAHYRAYQAATTAGDLATAEREAQAALEASIARDGDGGSTAVLAINLANTRLALFRPADAYEPALRAYNIAAAGSASVNPLTAKLVLGRASLTREHIDEGERLLNEAIAEARAQPDFNSETYLAASEFARWLTVDGRYERARPMWTIAGELAQAADGHHAYATAEAHAGAAVALIADTMQDVMRARRRATDTNLGPDAHRRLSEADASLEAAQQLMQPYAFARGEHDSLSLGQIMFANTVAWRVLARAFLVSHGERPMVDFELNQSVQSTDLRPICHLQMVAEPRPNFPPGANASFTAGAVVVRMRLDEQGNLLSSRVAAAVPDRWFRDAVDEVAPQWRLERLADSAPDCRYPAILYMTYQFYFR